jgi:tRNA pseudouridine38-40 synthase
VVREAREAAEGWHPRFKAIRRHYRYVILNRRARPALELGRVWHLPHDLDAGSMAQGARHLLGRHDFTSFRAASCQANSPLRTLDRLDVRRDGAHVIIETEARSFLHHQVRNMVGTLKLVGDGLWAPERVAQALAARARAAAGPTAPPDGLTFMAVDYDPPVFKSPLD